jgi:beta-glucosidase-like glycosyl hydrolase
MKGVVTVPGAIALGLSLLPSTAYAKKSVSASVQAGYHVIYSYSGATPPGELDTLITEGLVGGVILFGDNVNANLPSYVEDWQSTYKSSPFYAGSPLLIMTDQEGGEVKRLPGGPTSSEKQIGESSNPQSAASQAGSQAASALGAYNMNANLAPVLDVFRTPGDFDDQYQRSYSDNATLAGICGAAFIKAQQGAGYVATTKHFPGLGAAAANQDTDAEPVTITLSLSELQSVDELPYVAAIAAGVDMVMPSWALYPALDASNPSGLSSKWIQGELRQRLGFKGVTISDAIEAGALTSFGSNSTRSIKAVQAGMDIILAAARDTAQGESIVTSLASALSSGTIDATTFSQSSARILALRSKLG